MRAEVKLWKFLSREIGKWLESVLKSLFYFAYFSYLIHFLFFLLAR